MIRLIRCATAVALGAFATANWAADGSLDTTFGTGGKVQKNYAGTAGDSFARIAVLPDSSIRAAGIFWRENDDEDVIENRVFIATFSSTGALLSDHMISNPDAVAENGGVTPAGDILLVSGEDAGDSAHAKIVKYGPTGTKLATLTYPAGTPTLTNGAWCAGRPLFEASKIVVPCLIVGADGKAKPALFRLNGGDLTLDTTSFGGDGIAVGTELGSGTLADGAGFSEAFDVVSDGAGGYYTLNLGEDVEDDVYPRTFRVYVQHFLASGAVDTAFGNAGIAEVMSVVSPSEANELNLEPNALFRDAAGRLYVGLQRWGNGTSSSLSAGLVARLTAAGALDATFGTNGISTVPNDRGYSVRAIFADGEGRPYLATDNRVQRLLANGTLDPSFDGMPSNIHALNGPAGCPMTGGQACFNSHWNSALVLDDGKRALLAGGVPDWVVEQGQPSPDNAILAMIKLDDEVDTTPDAFGFASKFNVALNTLVESDPVTVSGISAPAAVSVGGGAESQYRIGAGAWTSAPGEINNGDVVRVRHRSGGTPGVSVSTTLTIGGVSGSFTSSTPAADTTPEPFVFAAQTNVALSTPVVSNAATVSGINAPAPVGVSGGTSAGYSIGCTGSFTAAPGQIENGQTVCVRQTSSATPNTATTVTLTVGGVPAIFQVTTGAGDSTPDAFSFAPKTGVATATLVTSDTVTIAGIDTAAPVSISGGNGEYQIGGGAWTRTAGTITNGQAVRVRVVSSSSASTPVTTTLNVGGVTAAFTATTGTSDTTPDAFAFAPRTDVEPNTAITSDAVAISGVTAPTPISVSGGSYSVDGGAFVTAAGTVTENQSVRVRHTSSGQSKTTVKTTLTIGGVSAEFASTTKADTTPDAFSFAPQNGVPVSSQRTSETVLITGIDEATPISVTGGQYSISCAPNGFTAAAGTISSTQSVCVRHTASADFDTPVTTTLTVGGVSANFVSRTEAQDTTPDAFAFTAQTGVAKGVAVTSDTVTIAGINSPAPISVTGGTYSLNNGPFTSAPGTVQKDDQLRLRHTSAAADSTQVETTVTVGGVSRSFRSTTGDGTPNAFAFAAQNGVAPASTVTSAPVTIGGLSLAAPISVANGSYSINSETAFTTAAGTVNNGDVVRVRHTAAAGFSAQTATTLTVGGVQGTFTSTTAAADTTPEPFGFASQNGVGRGAVVTSAAITVAGLNTAAPIAVTGGSYSIGGGPFVTTAGTVQNGQQVRVRHTAAAGFDAATATTLTIGGVQGTFTSRTELRDVAPEPFSFPAVNDVEPGAEVTSGPVTIAGINDAAPISVTGGSYSIGDGPFVTAAGTITAGQTVRLRLTAAGAQDTATTATLTIGGVSADFTATTRREGGGDGGAAGLALLLPLLGAAWLRRRRHAEAGGTR